MSSDLEPKIANQSNWAEASANVSNTRVTRPLGRGLEDISHLFVRRSTDDPQTAQQKDAPVPERRPSQSGTRSGTVPLRLSEAIGRDQLVAFLKEFSGALEDGLRVIDSAVPCSPFGEIDLLAVDRSNQLVIVDVETSCVDGLLLRGVGQLEWVRRNIANVRRMYQGSVVNFSAQPRLFLVAPRFSPLLGSAVRQMTGPDINCVRYQGTDVSGWTGILLERVDREP